MLPRSTGQVAALSHKYVHSTVLMSCEVRVVPLTSGQQLETRRSASKYRPTQGWHYFLYWTSVYECTYVLSSSQHQSQITIIVKRCLWQLCSWENRLYYYYVFKRTYYVCIYRMCRKNSHFWVWSQLIIIIFLLNIQSDRPQSVYR